MEVLLHSRTLESPLITAVEKMSPLLLCNQRSVPVYCGYFHLWRHPHDLIDGASSDYIPECKCLDGANNVATASLPAVPLDEPTPLQRVLSNGPNVVVLGGWCWRKQ